jgi:hypothetical protein
MDPKIVARKGISRLLLGSGRTKAWEKADRHFHESHKICEMCGLPAGSLGAFDMPLAKDQEQLEAHDVFPYHKMSSEQQNDYGFIIKNLIMLHHFEHHHIAHGGDPTCQLYNPNIRQDAAYVLASMKSCIH